MLYNIVLISAINPANQSVYISSFWNLPPTASSRPSRSSQSPELSSLCYIVGCHTCGRTHTSIPIFQFTPHLHDHISVLYVCDSILALQIGSLVPFFYVTRICVNIQYLFYSFWITLLCMTLSVHSCLYKWPNIAPFYHRVIICFVYVAHLLYPFICWWTLRLLPYFGNCK